VVLPVVHFSLDGRTTSETGAINKYHSQRTAVLCSLLPYPSQVQLSSSLLPPMASSVFYSPATSNAFIPLSLIYTCVAHLWLYLSSGLSLLSLSWRNKKNVHTDEAVVVTHRILQQYVSLPPSSRSTYADPSNNSNDYKGNSRKIAIITGSNTGIGFQTAKTLVLDYGYHVILACRSKDKALQAQQNINNDNSMSRNGSGGSCRGQAIVLDSILDLADFESIRQFVKEVDEKYPSIDLLINNAGRNTSGELTCKKYRHMKSDEKETNKEDSDDFVSLDLMFVSNYLGHFLLTQLLLDKLKMENVVEGGDGPDGIISGMIVNVSSVMHHFNCYENGFVSAKNTVEAPGTTTAVTPSLSTSTNISPDNDDATCRQQYQYWKSRAHYHQSPKKPLPDVYSATKLAAILHAVELNRRYATVTALTNTANSEKNQVGSVYAMAVNPGAVNSDIWRGFPNWMRAIFQKVYLTTQQGSVPLVAAAVMGDYWKQQGVLYLQPYWKPFHLSSLSWSPLPAKLGPTMAAPMLPFTEMLGPYVGYTPAKPRLPDNDGGKEAARILWQISEELASIYS
jgi:NAD(P)-dependent dehydrogenase (short-subunit alcohol dehydrogenase family)